jgi:hypothetical protein
MAIPFLSCMLMTAHFYGLPPRVLPTIQAVEGGRPGLVHPNADGSADLGLMQINTLWVVPIAHVLHETEAQVAVRLIHDACFSIAAAGDILKLHYLERHDWMMAIGDYHSRTPPLNYSYQQMVRLRAEDLFASK